MHRGLKGRVVGKSFVPSCAQGSQGKSFVPSCAHGSQWEELSGRVLYHLVHRGLKGRVIGKSFVPSCAQGSQGKSYWEEFCTIFCTGVSMEELLGTVLYHLVHRGVKGSVIGKSLYHLVHRGLKGRVIGKSFVPFSSDHRAGGSIPGGSGCSVFIQTAT